MATTDVVRGTELTSIDTVPVVKPTRPWPGSVVRLWGSRTVAALDKEVHLVRMEPGDIVVGCKLLQNGLGGNTQASIGKSVPANIGNAGTATAIGSPNCAFYTAIFLTAVTSDNFYGAGQTQIATTSAFPSYDCSQVMKQAAFGTAVTVETDVVVRLGVDTTPWTAGQAMTLIVDMIRPGTA